MKIVFNLGASDDLDHIFDWIARDSRSAAFDMIRRLEARIFQLTNPELAHIGRAGFVEGTRELIEWPYIIVYEVHERDAEVVILAIAHAAQDRQSFHP